MGLMDAGRKRVAHFPEKIFRHFSSDKKNPVGNKGFFQTYTIATKKNEKNQISPFFLFDNKNNIGIHRQ
jgi:hypothetical protein